ncbi:MAG TPA: urease accessory protein UreE [Acetobacteraceae bacterium]|jgi:urease accessory protein|nr:urease accessory protein UreE [Acetobacteraceae bacterium]
MRAGEVLPAGTWPEDQEVDRVRIDFDRRHRRRLMLATETGADLLIDLPEARRLREGDGLRLEKGGVVRVLARPESLLEIRAPDADALVRIAWHLGNRHLPVQLLAGRILIHADHVIADMVRLLGATVTPREAPFDPEPGAYEGGHHHHHEDDDECGAN